MAQWWWYHYSKVRHPKGFTLLRTKHRRTGEIKDYDVCGHLGDLSLIEKAKTFIRSIGLKVPIPCPEQHVFQLLLEDSDAEYLHLFEYSAIDYGDDVLVRVEGQTRCKSWEELDNYIELIDLSQFVGAPIEAISQVLAGITERRIMLLDFYGVGGVSDRSKEKITEMMRIFKNRRVRQARKHYMGRR